MTNIEKALRLLCDAEIDTSDGMRRVSEAEDLLRAELRADMTADRIAELNAELVEKDREIDRLELHRAHFRRGVRKLTQQVRQLREAMEILLVQIPAYKDGDGAAYYHARNMAQKALEQTQPLVSTSKATLVADVITEAMGNMVALKAAGWTKQDFADALGGMFNDGGAQ